MVYTTETLPKASAEGDSSEDLGYGISSGNASVTVGTACTFSASVTNPHTSTIGNGLSSDNIGTTILNTTCNDSGGYAVYAIGYTNEEYGNTSLTYSSLDSTPENPITNSNYDIPTGTATSGNTSSWAMKLDTVSGTTTATIEADTNGSFSNYHIVPEDYTKVATLNTVTDGAAVSSATGSSISTTYQAYISPTQAPGTYTGKVKYTLVHPSTAPKPEKPVFMQDTAKIKSLLVNEGDTMQAVDSRDGKKYWITKLADGNIWMTQNLDLDIEAGRTYTSADTDLANSTIGTSWTPTSSEATYPTGTTTWNISYTAPQSYDPGDFYWNGALIYNYETCTSNGGTWYSDYQSAYCYNYNITTSTGNAHYHLGNYYNWTAAVAMSDSSSYTSQYTDVNQSICPAGWRLPTYEGDKSYQNLVDILSLSAGTSGNIQNDPVYFVYGGYKPDGGSIESMGNFVRYWSGIVRNGAYSYMLLTRIYTNGSANLNPKNDNSRDIGLSLRCVAR